MCLVFSYHVGDITCCNVKFYKLKTRQSVVMKNPFKAPKFEKPMYVIGRFKFFVHYPLKDMRIAIQWVMGIPVHHISTHLYLI